MESLDKLLEVASSEISGAESLEALKEVQSSLIGKSGRVTELFKGVKDLPPEERKGAGAKINSLKEEIVSLIEEKQEELEEGGSTFELDTTLPGTRVQKGGLHPNIELMYQLNDAFRSLGFEVYEGPEISDEGYAFDKLNFSPDHPARESMDTYWLKGYEDKAGADRLCLRPHLTGGSVRYMEKREPPFRFVYPGRVFRNESTDASHERAFFQYEALIVDKEVPFSSVRIMVDTILKRVFGREVKTRMRSGFFPFVEPGFEIDMQCLVCEGDGCSVCSQTGWVEMMPGGPPHPNVLKAAGLDPNEWQGAYINIGLDRLVMMKYGIDDVRLFSSGDLRFLEQFN